MKMSRFLVILHFEIHLNREINYLNCVNVLEVYIKKL
jgi:hypothetical protein